MTDDEKKNRAVIGSLGAGAIADRYGRKWALFICYIFVYIAITLETVSTTNEIFFAGKFMAGFAVGGFITTSMTYIGEISPLALRGVLTAAAAISFTIGPLIVALVVNVTGTKTDRWAYRTIFVSQYGVNTLGALFLPFMPESPWWLVGQQKMDKAARALSRLGYDALNVEKRIAVISVTLEEIRKETDGASYIECFRKSNLRRTIISAAPLSIQALCGVLFIASYSTYYQQLAGYSTEESFTLAIVQQILAMSGNIVSWFLIDRVGRRDLTLWGMITLTILLTVTGGLAVSATPSAIKGTVALLLLYNFVYNATIGATAYSLLTEIATSRLRAKTASMALSLQNGLFVSLDSFLVRCVNRNTDLENLSRPYWHLCSHFYSTPTRLTLARRCPSFLGASPSSVQSTSGSTSRRPQAGRTRNWTSYSSRRYRLASSRDIRPMSR